MPCPYNLQSKTRSCCSSLPCRAARVTSIELVVERGVFMPHTTQGAIVVNGVVAPEMAATHVPSWAASLKLHSSVISVLR